MAFNQAPIKFFGPGYARTSSEIKFPTADFADITVGTFTCVAASAVLAISADHNLKVGDKVELSTSAADLPEPFAAATVYFVVGLGTSPSTTSLTLSLTKGGAAIAATDAGTGVHTMVAKAPLHDVIDAEAHATTGDSRKIIFGFMELFYRKFIGTPPADRPAKLSITRGSGSNDVTGNITRTYTVTIVTTPTAIEVSDE